MAEKLESIVSNLNKGIVTGVATIADPLGTLVSGIDYYLTGVGASDKDRALPVFYNHTCQKFYDEPDKNVSIMRGYFPRITGNIIGGTAAVFGELALYSAGGLAAALAVPGFFAIYCGVGTIQRYAKDLFRGEKISGGFEKAHFETGFSLGYHEATNPLMLLAHDLETTFTGRNIGKSHVHSTMKKSASVMRRNIGSIIGYGVGAVVGLAVDVLTLGIAPVYNALSDIHMNYKVVRN